MLPSLHWVIKPRPRQARSLLWSLTVFVKHKARVANSALGRSPCLHLHVCVKTRATVP